MTAPDGHINKGGGKYRRGDDQAQNCACSFRTHFFSFRSGYQILGFGNDLEVRQSPISTSRAGEAATVGSSGLFMSCGRRNAKRYSFWRYAGLWCMDLSSRLAVEISLRSGIEIERKFNG
jgi:hypothetical protein